MQIPERLQDICNTCYTRHSECCERVDGNLNPSEVGECKLTYEKKNQGTNKDMTFIYTHFRNEKTEKCEQKIETDFTSCECEFEYVGQGTCCGTDQKCPSDKKHHLETCSYVDGCDRGQYGKLNTEFGYSCSCSGRKFLCSSCYRAKALACANK